MRTDRVFPSPCAGVGCHAILRQNKAKAADFPGTRVHQARGLCSTCYTRYRRNVIVKPAPVPDRVANDARCVLVRVDLTPSTYRTLKHFAVDIDLELSKLADKMADALRSNHA